MIGRRKRPVDGASAWIGRRRARDLAFLNQFDLAQRVTRRDGDRESAAALAALLAEVRIAIFSRQCSVDDITRAVREAQPSRELLAEDELPQEDTPAERPRARAVNRLLTRVLGRLRGRGGDEL